MKANKQEQVKFSIITVAYNSDKTIAKTIQSVLAQTYPPYEYFVIDGASSDRTVQIANSFKNKFQEKKVRYSVISEPDSGMYDALNKGVQLASGTLIGQINSDDWYESDALESMAELYELSNFDMAYADLYMILPSGRKWIKKARVDRFVNSRGWNHPTQFTKRNVLLEHPYQCKCMSDDLDLMLWIRKNGYKVRVLNKAIANFTMQGMSHSRDIKQVIDRVITKTRIYTQNGYTWIHGVDVAVVEMAKYILGK